ncbi:hypothetical protein [Neorhizobium alkalisoli]|uniref:Uncharacterized protein n=1 Tax=Neorhizobium alkalisoli TaxID=528178 RepID=A0A561QUU6_9HYPH|nr:hypothetical protein [Neorhizobium alkalisoli]TWF54151.1 hypothetical protein FHW37_10310 [Neorhizobium alkalisoli]
MDFDKFVEFAVALRETVAKPFCFDEGRAAAMQGIHFVRGNPYARETEPESHQSWNDGWLSINEPQQ